ncbi:MAG: hypothetical protein HY553_08665 [Elusimicrobia bacterium]|nr:hypothetical protein [Elusimicrobiota bacterium]
MSFAGIVVLAACVGPAAAAGSVLPELSRSARSHSLGDGGALLQGIHALGENPAALATGRRELLSQYQRLPLDTFFSLLGYAQPLGRTGATLVPSYGTLQSRSFEGRDASGRRAGEFSHEEHLLGLHAAYQRDAVTVGAGARRLEVRVGSWRSSAYGIDCGARWRFEDKPVSLAVGALNLGSDDDSLARRFTAAAAADVAGPFSVSATYGWSPAGRRGDVTVGSELRLGALFAVRGRYTVAAGQDGGVQRAAGSVGFNPLPDLALDYGFDPYPEQVRAAGEAGVHRVKVSYRFAAPREPEPAAPRPDYWRHYWRAEPR